LPILRKVDGLIEAEMFQQPAAWFDDGSAPPWPMRMSLGYGPGPSDFLRWPEGAAPRFLVTVDTEEEFDWASPLHRDAHGLATIATLGVDPQIYRVGRYGAGPNTAAIVR
jgi:hypothetical protein